MSVVEERGGEKGRRKGRGRRKGVGRERRERGVGVIRERRNMRNKEMSI